MTSSSPLIRPASEADLPAITAIYAYNVLHGTGTFETEPPDEVQMLDRMQDVHKHQLPWLVLESEGKVLGFAYCNWFRPRPAFRFCAEDSIYFAPEATSKGWGTQLLQALLQRAEQAGVRRMVAVVGDAANAASIGLHRRCGYSEIGRMRDCGWKFERWLDVVLMDRPLGEGSSSAPA